MAVIKILLTGLVAVALSVSAASAQRDSISKKRAEVVSKRSILAIKPMSDLQNQQQKRVFNSVVVSHVPVERLDVIEAFPYAVHNTAVSKDCYTRFGSPAVIVVMGYTFNIDCSTWVYLSAE